MSGSRHFRNLSLIMNFKCIFHLLWNAKFKFFFHQDRKKKKNNCFQSFFWQSLNFEFRFSFQCHLIFGWKYAFNLHFKLRLKLKLSGVMADSGGLSPLALPGCHGSSLDPFGQPRFFYWGSAGCWSMVESVGRLITWSSQVPVVFKPLRLQNATNR